MSEETSAAGRALRKIVSEKRTAACAANAAVARANIRPKPLRPCTCHVGASGGVHGSSCPVYMRAKKRESRARKKV